MTDENTQPETDDVEGHKRRNLFVADESDAGDDTTDDVEGHKRRNLFVADETDDADEDVEGHKRRSTRG